MHIFADFNFWTDNYRLNESEKSVFIGVWQVQIGLDNKSVQEPIRNQKYHAIGTWARDWR